jgi:rifampin ADP-ribosylating transferase
MRGATLAASDEGISGPFYHGTKADLRIGDLITPGYRSNYGQGVRRTRWVYMTATVLPLGAELARGDGPGRLYIVEPTGPFEDDPDLTDKKFPGNPTRSYRSRAPLQVVGEVTDWQPHAPEEIKAMLDAQDRLYDQQAARIARIPSEADVGRVHARADELAHEWMRDAAYVGCTMLMLIEGTDVEVFSAMEYRSEVRGETRTIQLPRPLEVQPDWSLGDISLSGRATDVTAWREGWAAVIESCITEIGLSLQTRIWAAVDADHDRLVFRVDADGPERSWRRDLRLVRGVLTDAEQGELWDHETDCPDW